MIKQAPKLARTICLLLGIPVFIVSCINHSPLELDQPLIDSCQKPDITFAAIGDFGLAGEGAASVARLVVSWSPELIITVGDNNYPDGEAQTIDANVGQYYSAFIGHYRGNYGGGSAPDRATNFYPSLGNHDYKVVAKSGLPPKPYLDYFTLPGNERYYQFERGPVAFFAINSNAEEPDGITAESIQGQWLEEQLALSEAQWKIVYFHHAPFSSREYGGSSIWMRWPFKAWGADAVLSGHDHIYERFEQDGLLYLVNGLGGNSIYPKGTAAEGSLFQYNEKHAALRVTANADCMRFQLISHDGELIDESRLIHE